MVRLVHCTSGPAGLCGSFELKKSCYFIVVTHFAFIYVSNRNPRTYSNSTFVQRNTYVRNWQAKEIENTSFERREIVAEAREKFHANKGVGIFYLEVTNPESISNLIQQAEKRLVEMSTLQASSITNVIENEKCRRTTFDFTSCDPLFISFVRHYFSGTKVPPDIVSFVVKKCLESKQFYYFFVHSVLCNVLFDTYPTKKSYRRNLLKIIIAQLEENNVDIYDKLYTTLTDCMLESMNTSYRIYLNPKGSSILSLICESNKQLLYGTTGLSVWQASCDLSDVLTRFVDLSEKHVLELGAGCGLTGMLFLFILSGFRIVYWACISVARTYPSSTVTLTDFDPKVLEQLKRNVDENMGEVGLQTFYTYINENMLDLYLYLKCCSRVHVKHFDWSDMDAFAMKPPPDVVIGAVFKNKLGVSGLSVTDEVYYQRDVFTFRDGSKYRSSTFFPHSSTLDAPTVIYKIAVD
uniref:FAM86 domain-containing protein n=1 Tax=Heterorhabditis bacteriophora TaxID=37862 RepID=A0A1I7WAI0_HETBA